MAMLQTHIYFGISSSFCFNLFKEGFWFFFPINFLLKRAHLRPASSELPYLQLVGLLLSLGSDAPWLDPGPFQGMEVGFLLLGLPRSSSLRDEWLSGGPNLQAGNCSSRERQRERASLHGPEPCQHQLVSFISASACLGRQIQSPPLPDYRIRP